MLTAFVTAALVVLAQPRAADPSPAPTLSESQKRALDGALGGLLADKTVTLSPNETCDFALSISANPKRRDHGVRMTVTPVDPDAAEMPAAGRFAFARLHLDAYEKKIEKGPDDVLEFAPLTGDVFGGSANVVVPWERFLEVTRPVDRNLYFLGIDGARGSPCILDASATKTLFDFRAKLQ